MESLIRQPFECHVKRKRALLRNEDLNVVKLQVILEGPSSDGTKNSELKVIFYFGKWWHHINTNDSQL